MTNDIKRTCKTHGYTVFKYRENKKGHWYSCHKCLKAQWRKSTAKFVRKPGQREYHREYSTRNYRIMKSLSIFLTMILLAAKIKPE